MTERSPRSAGLLLIGLVITTALAVVASLGWYREWRQAEGTTVQGGDDHKGHDHEDDPHAGHDHSAGEILHLSDAALQNVGYTPHTVALTDFVKTLTLPAVVVERPGQTQIHLAAPFTGIVTEVHAAQGEAVAPGTVMFRLRLTHEDLVATQRDFLQTTEQLEIARREIKRLQSLGEGVVAEKRILEQQYEVQKLEASLLSTEQAMLLHGLTEEQVKQVSSDRKLLRSVDVKAPDHFHDDHACEGEHLLHVQQLEVTTGQQVESGAELCLLADHCELFVEGQAFEDDTRRLREVVRSGASIKARLLVAEGEVGEVDGLKLLYLADRVDPQTRALRFYLRLPNSIELDQSPTAHRRFIEWRFKPGQRMELSIPVEVMPQQIALPATAVVQEGPENYVFRRDGDHFDRVPVHVKHRDTRSVVVSPLGTLKPGDVVAAKGAYQMHLALKNMAGGAVDPHAGHNH